MKCVACGAGQIRGLDRCYRCGGAAFQLPVASLPAAPDAPHAPPELPASPLRRPLGVWVFGALALLASVVAMAGALFAPFVLVVALFYGAIGVGTLAGWRWMWYVLVVTHALAGVGALVLALAGEFDVDFLAGVYSGLWAVYFAIPPVRAYFRVSLRADRRVGVAAG